MMLDLMLAGANGRVLSASDLATGAGVPLSSGLRMIASLEQRGLVHRSIDERAPPRTILRLSAGGIDRMASYFMKIADVRQAPHQQVHSPSPPCIIRHASAATQL